MHEDEEQLKRFLLHAGLVGVSDIEEAHARSQNKGTSLKDELAGMEYLSSESIRKAEAHILGIPYISLDETTLVDEALLLVPEPFARTHNIIGIKKEGGALHVALLDPKTLKEAEFLERKTECTLIPHLTDSHSMRRALLYYQKRLRSVYGDAIKEHVVNFKSAELPTETNVEENEEARVELLRKKTNSEHITLLLSSILKHAHVQHASDIHIEPNEENLRIRYRINGKLYEAMRLPYEVHEALIGRIKLASGMDIRKNTSPQDGKCTISFEDEPYSLRVSTMPTRSGEKVAVRILPSCVKGFTLEGLGFIGASLENLSRAIEKTSGMTLIAGPASSGKTTTLYTVLDILNNPNISIATIEDPIQYQIPRISQTAVDPEQGLTFKRGLTGILRQDPDVIAIGEMRDTELMLQAASAATARRRIITTLHTEMRTSEIPALLGSAVQMHAIASSLNAIVAQRLVRKLGSAVKKAHLSKHEYELLKEMVDTRRLLKLLREEGLIGKEDTWRDIYFYTPNKQDEGGGYEGLVGVYEVLPLTDASKELIKDDATPAKIEEQGIRDGMITLLEDGIMKAVAGRTTFDEVVRLSSR